MHGRKRAQREELDAPEVRAAKVDKYKQYLAACKSALENDENAQRAEKVLRYNPDFFTLWNSRRRLIQKELEAAVAEGSDATKEYKIRVLARELSLTKDQIAERNSKSYGAWHHRRWSIELLGWHEGGDVCDWQAELALCDALLERDERNFHCWAHRNFVASCAGVTNADDYAKSTALISKNFSNYSAWHLRAQSVLRGGTVVDWAKEFDLVHQAVFTEPADQSAWLYYRWMLTQANALSESTRIPDELDTIRSLIEEEGECKWPLIALVQLLSLLPLDADRQREAMDVCSRLGKVDKLHRNFYTYVSTLFELANFSKLRKVLFVSSPHQLPS